MNTKIRLRIKKSFHILQKAVFVFAIVISCSENKEELKIVDTILRDSSSYFFTDLRSYSNISSKLPIGIFDSGTGGLTVLDAIINYDSHNNSDRTFNLFGDSLRDFQNESFIYLADQANMPYGNYGIHDKALLLKEHVIKDVQFLLDRKYYRKSTDQNFQTDKSNIKALVIACNTATAYALEEIEALISSAGLKLKVIGIIGAGVRGALKNSDLRNDFTIGIMATAGTVASNGYVKELNKHLNNISEKGNISIIQQAGIGLAGAIDNAPEFIDISAEGPRKNYKGPSENNDLLKIDLSILKRYNFNWDNNEMLFQGSKENPDNIQINSVENYISYHLTDMMEKMREKKSDNKLKSIVLGCTHYPFYTEVFKSKINDLRNYKEQGEFIYRSYLADSIVFVDPAVYAAKELYDYLFAENLFNVGDLYESEFYISVPNLLNDRIITDDKGNFSYDYKYGRIENHIQEYVKRVPFSKNNISKSVAQRLKNKIPFTYSVITNFNQSNQKVAFLKPEDKLN